MRLMSDAYGKGIVRGQAENTNLRAYGKDHDITSAECFRTCQTESFCGRECIDLVHRLNDGLMSDKKAFFSEIDLRDPGRRKIFFRDVAM